MKRTYGVSVVSLLPFSMGGDGPWRAIDIAKEAGFNGLQVLPFRGWDYTSFFGIPRYEIISYGKEWNSGTWRGAIKRLMRCAGEEESTLIDVTLFGKPEEISERNYFFQKNFFDAVGFTNNLSDERCLEIHPELRLSAEFYAKYPHGVVLDTKHLERPGRHGESPVTTDCRRFLEKVMGNIRLIQVDRNASPEILRMLGRETICPVILECGPPIKRLLCVPPWRIKEEMTRWLREEREFVGKFFG